MKKHVEAAHLKLKRFFCAQCDYACYHRSHLTAHVIARQTAEKLFVCRLRRRREGGPREALHGRPHEAEGAQVRRVRSPFADKSSLRDHVKVIAHY
jgi:hypothetical protein